MKINPNIFKAYDIRGIYPEEINEEAAYRIGQAFVEFLENKGEIGNRQIIVGRDARLSSATLFEAITKGICSQSVDVLDIGQVSTPLFYWAIIAKQTAGGVMITASHNPAQYNGFKFCREKALPISSRSGLFQIRDLIQKDQILKVSFAPGKITSQNLLDEYLNFIKQKIDITKIKPLRIIIDCANGMIGPEVQELFKELSCQSEILFADPDGRFPNHEPNPLKDETLLTLKERILSNHVDLGVAFDGDGDRVKFLDEKGEAVRGDFITALLAKEILKNTPGCKIFYEVRSSRIVPEVIKANGGMPILGQCGHSLIKEKMRQEDILFGGELSGHYFFKELGFVDNALFTMLKILEVLSREQKQFSEIITPFKKYYQSGEINFAISEPDRKLKEIENHFSDAKIKKIDGLTVEYSDWWFNLRASETEPVIRLNLEAKTKELMEEKKEELTNLIENL